MTERKTNAHRPQGKTVENRQITVIYTVKYEAHEHHPMTEALVRSHTKPNKYNIDIKLLPKRGV